MNQNELNFAALGVCQPHSSLLATVGTQTNQLFFNKTSPAWAGFIDTNAATSAYVPFGSATTVNNFNIGTTGIGAAMYIPTTSAYTTVNNLFIANTGPTAIGWKNTMNDINTSVFATSNHLSITGRTGTDNFLFKTSDYGTGMATGAVTLPMVAGGTNYLSTAIAKDYSTIFCTKPSNSIAFAGTTGITVESILGTKPQTSFAFTSHNPTASLTISSGVNLFGIGATKVTETIGSMYMNQPVNFFGTTNVGANTFVVGSQPSVLGWFKDTRENLYTGLTHSAATIKSTMAPVFTAGKELVGLMNQLKDNVNVDHFGFDYDTEYSGSNVTINFHFHLTVNNISGTYAHIGNNIYNRIK